MRLAYVCTDRNLALFGNSGRAAWVQEVLRSLIRRGAQIDVYAARLDGDRPDGLRSLVVHKLSLSGGDPSSGDNAPQRANQELRRQLQSARGGRFEAIIERFSPWSYAGMEFAIASGIAGILEVTDPGIDEMPGLPEDAQRAAAKTLETATTVLAGSGRIAEELKAFGIRARLFPAGLDPERYSTGARLTIRKTGAFTIGYRGTFSSWDTILPLVEAFTLLHRKHPEARLLVEGEGPAKPQMITELSRRGLLGTAFFLGKVPARRVAGVLAATDITVICDEQDRAFIQDSMLCGVPVVSCLRDDPLVRNRINGMRCTGQGELFDALDMLYSDRILRLRLGSNARRGLLNDQVWDEIATILLESAGSPVPGHAFAPASTYVSIEQDAPDGAPTSPPPQWTGIQAGK